MFGYVIADLARLDEGQQTRYKSFYCGLCRALYRGYGPVPALALTYDMAFLTLFLSALYEPAEQSGAARCLRHPACLFNISIASEASISSSYKLIISIPILIKLSSKVNSSFKIYSSLSKILSL